MRNDEADKQLKTAETPTQSLCHQLEELIRIAEGINTSAAKKTTAELKATLKRLKAESSPEIK